MRAAQPASVLRPTGTGDVRGAHVIVGWFLVGPMVSVCVKHAATEAEARGAGAGRPDAVSAVVPLYQGDDEMHECIVGGHLFETA